MILTRRPLILTILICCLVLVGCWFLRAQWGVGEWRHDVFFSNASHYSVALFVLDMIALVTGITLIFIVPGLLWIYGMEKEGGDGFDLGVCSFLLSGGGLILLTTFYKVVSQQALSFQPFVMMVAGVVLAGLVFVLRRESSSRTNRIIISGRGTAAAGLVLVLFMMFIWMSRDKALWAPLEQDYSERHVLAIPLGAQNDVFEAFGRINSLKSHLWPYWDLEYADRFGFVAIDPPLYSFLGLVLVLAFGNHFAVMSLANLIFVILNTIVVMKIVAAARPNRSRILTRVLGFSLAGTYFLVLLSNANPYESLVDMSFLTTFFVLVQYYYLFQKRYGLFLVCSLLAFLVQYEAALFTVTGLMAYRLYFKNEQKQVDHVFRRYLTGILFYLVFVLVLGIKTGVAGVFLKSLVIEKLIRIDLFHFLEKIYPVGTKEWDSFSFSRSGSYFLSFLRATLLTGSAMFLPKHDKFAKVLSIMGIVFLALVFASRYQRLHYLTPLVFISMTNFLIWVNEIKSNNSPC